MTEPTAPSPVELLLARQELALRLLAQHDHAVQRMASLTPCERECVRLLSKGLTLKQAGAVLGRHWQTINDHLKQVYRKLEVDSRGEMASIAAKAGLV